MTEKILILSVLAVIYIIGIVVVTLKFRYDAYGYYGWTHESVKNQTIEGFGFSLIWPAILFLMAVVAVIFICVYPFIWLFEKAFDKITKANFLRPKNADEMKKKVREK